MIAGPDSFLHFGKMFLQRVCQRNGGNSIDNVIIVVNAGNALELGFLNEHPSIKSALWVGTPGTKGANSLGKTLAGNLNPSGRLVDTYAYDAGSQRLFVTGKLWPKLFEIELLSPTGVPAPLTCK